VIVIGLWAIISGTAELAAAWNGRVSGSGWLTVGGLLSIAAGVLLLIWPGIGAVSIAVVFGAFLAAYGLTMLAAAAMTPSGQGVDALA